MIIIQGDVTAIRLTTIQGTHDLLTWEQLSYEITQELNKRHYNRGTGHFWGLKVEVLAPNDKGEMCFSLNDKIEVEFNDGYILEFRLTNVRSQYNGYTFEATKHPTIYALDPQWKEYDA